MKISICYLLNLLIVRYTIHIKMSDFVFECFIFIIAVKVHIPAYYATKNNEPLRISHLLQVFIHLTSLPYLF